MIPRNSYDPKKFLTSPPYIMYMIERVTMIIFPKDCKHEPLRIRPRSGDAPRAPPLHAGATRNSRFDPAPSYSGPSSSHQGHSSSFIKRALKIIFCMCKSMANEINENRRDIIEIKNHLGLPTDPYHELLEFDDPFAKWDAADEAAVTASHAPLPRPRCRTRPPTRSRRSPPVVKKFLMKMRRPKKKSHVTTASTPTPMRTRIHPMVASKMMMMSRIFYHCFSFPFWHLMTKGNENIIYVLIWALYQT
jgi:hypothetical protein